MANSGTAHARRTELLDAVLAVSADLELDSVLHRIVGSACRLTGARYGFLAVLSEDGEVTDQVVHGLSAEDARKLGALPVGRGLMGESVRQSADETATTFVGLPIRFQDTVLGQLYLSDKADGLPFDEEDEDAVAVLARVAGVAVRNARTFHLSERRREWVEAIAALADSLHPPVALSEPLARIATGARRVARASLAAVVHSTEHGFDVPAADGPAYATLAELLDTFGERISIAQTSGESFEAQYDDDGSVAVFPLDAALAFQGVLLVVTERGCGRLPAEDRELLTSFAAQASLAMDRAVALVDRQQAMVAADRDRIARDLHDLVIQRLFATGLQLQGGRRSGIPPETQERIDNAVRDLDVTIRDIRSTIFELQHGHESSLRAGVVGLVREYAEVLGFPPTVRTTGPLDSLVSRPLAEQALAVLREALSNCARHAAARSCLVELELEEGWLTLRVVDDGVGLEDVVHESGLRNLRRRADELGGSLLLAPSEPAGTRFEWRVPVPECQGA
ncbi:GAF domain-containing protein [Nocardioides sp. GCM10027113]|uniref:GAF domain-containing sensor histidine kinase n=1 Tax=unclassified Nocardioides TaxID=2615069 RepID=UPI00361270FE